MSEAVATAVRTEASLVARRMSSRASTLVGSARATVSTSWAIVTGTTPWRTATLRGSTASVSSGDGQVAQVQEGQAELVGGGARDRDLVGQAGRQCTPECWTMLSALAVLTSRARLGTLVLATGFRPPTLLAKMAATLDQLAGGRLDLGLGAGWNEAEFTENGLPFPRPGERLAMLEEALGVLRALLTDAGTPASFSGRHYHADQAPVLPGPVQRPRPPLWVGGKGDRLLGVV